MRVGNLPTNGRIVVLYSNIVWLLLNGSYAILLHDPVGKSYASCALFLLHEYPYDGFIDYLYIHILYKKNEEILPSRSVGCNISDFIVNPSTGKTRRTYYTI